MTETAVPSSRGLDGATCHFIRGRPRLQRVETTFAVSSKKNFLHCQILNQKIIWMKFHECMIVRSEAMDRGKIFASFRYIMNIIEDKISIWGMNKTSTNSVDSHTSAIGGVHLTGAMIFFPHSEFVQLAGDVIGRTVSVYQFVSMS
jgi:hypothetical protein